MSMLQEFKEFAVKGNVIDRSDNPAGRALNRREIGRAHV